MTEDAASAYTAAARDLGAQLRALREAVPKLSGARLAFGLGWAQSKVSRIETGKQTPTEADIAAWTAAVDASEEARAALLAALAVVQDEYVSWRRQLRRGAFAVKQDDLRELESATSIRVFESVLVNGLLQTAEYARHVFAATTRAAGLDVDPAELSDAAARRVRRQEALYDPGRVHIIMGEAALRYRTCPPAVQRGQLDRLLTLLDLETARVGIIPFTVQLPLVASHDFWIYDDIVVVETFSAELVLRTPRDVELYSRIFTTLDEVAHYGPDAKPIVLRALADLS